MLLFCSESAVIFVLEELSFLLNMKQLMLGVFSSTNCVLTESDFILFFFSFYFKDAVILY